MKLMSEPVREKDIFVLDAYYDELNVPANRRRYPETKREARELIYKLQTILIRRDNA